MPLFDIKMPKLGESITEGTIMSWHVNVGDPVKEDDMLFEVSTQKVSAEIPSPISGTVKEILAQVDDTVAVGTVVARILPEGEADGGMVQGGKVEGAGAEVRGEEDKKDKEGGRFYSPYIMQVAKEANISMEELEKIPGTGYKGRVSKEDFEQYLEQKSKGKAAGAAPVVKPVEASVNKPVVADNILLAEGDVVEDMDFIRKVTADHMVMSKKTSPHVTSIIEIDVTKLVHWHARHKDEFLKKEGVKLTFMPAITEAVVKALSDFPRVNASVNGYKVILKKQINIGIAVALDNGNLIVPVVHNAEDLSLTGLAHTIDALAKKSRENKLSPDDITGGTFTITNYGTFKTLFATPIINQPQVAILGVGYIEKKPSVVTTDDGDVIAIRHKMYLSLSYDHRIIDGALGGNFLRRVGDYLEKLEITN